MRPDILDRIQRAIDAGATVDDELEREFASDPDAMRLASELVAIDEALRNWPDPRVSDKTLDAIVMRVEQRLDERLAPIGDPTAAPIFEEEEAISISIAPAVSRSPDVAELRQLATPRHSAETLPPDLLESIPPEAPADLVASIARMPPKTDERFEIPSVRPQPVVVPIARRSERAPIAPPPKKSGATVIWLVGGTLAAAAAALLAVAVGTFGTTRDEVAQSTPDRTSLEAAEPAAASQLAPAPPPSAMPIGAGGGGYDLARAEPADEAELDEGASANNEFGLDLADGAQAPAEEAQGSPARTIETSSTDERRRVRSDPASDEQRRGGAGSPTREQILAAMRSVAPAVGACGGGARTGVAEVRVRLGSSGRVQSAVVTGQFAGTPEGTCIARAVRGARVPPFRQASFDFTYPFRIN